MGLESHSRTEKQTRPVVISWGKGLEVTAEDTRRALVLPSASASDDERISAVYDHGDSGQLQQKPNPARIPNHDDAGHLLSGAGYQLGPPFAPTRRGLSTATTLQSSQENTHTTEEDTAGGTLEQQIRASLRASSGKNREKFLPIDKLDQVITWESVYNELSRVLQDRSQDDLQKLAHKIWDKVQVPETPATSRRKIFATLVCIDRTACITCFINDGLYDCHLPFHFKDSSQNGIQVYRKSTQGGDIEIRCFSRMGWPNLACENFQHYQWEFQAPVFEIMSDGKRKWPLHYTLDDRAVLPFVEDSDEESPGGPSMTSGGYSDVWRVRIHPAHHSHPSLRNPLFAVKRLRPNNRSEEMFRREVATLKRLSGQDHAHLIKLQMTYLYRDRYHLLFRWANGNLRDYWQHHPDTSDIPRTRGFASWVASQWLGLARGLLAIHHCPLDEDIELDDEQSTDGFESQRVNGRHGDIKPENILWFHSYDAQDDQPLEHGKLVISDFGLTEFHRLETGFVSPLNVGRSPTYRAPECDVAVDISQSYDIWTLGCVLLEFIVWYLQGFEAFDQFSQNRTTEDNRPIAEDVYFAISPRIEAKDGKVLSAAVLKKSVPSQIDALRQDPNVTDFIVDSLDFIEQQMLRMHPEKRASCDQVVAMFESIYERTVEDEEYCVRPVPGKSRRAGTDLSTLAQSPYLVFDPDSMQPVSEENVLQAEISANHAQKTQSPQCDIPAGPQQQLSPAVEMTEPNSTTLESIAASDGLRNRSAQVHHSTPRSIGDDNKSTAGVQHPRHAWTDRNKSSSNPRTKQKRPWFRRLFCGFWGF